MLSSRYPYIEALGSCRYTLLCFYSFYCLMHSWATLWSQYTIEQKQTTEKFKARSFPGQYTMNFTSISLFIIASIVVVIHVPCIISCNVWNCDTHFQFQCLPLGYRMLDDKHTCCCTCPLYPLLLCSDYRVIDCRIQVVGGIEQAQLLNCLCKIYLLGLLSAISVFPTTN